MKELRKKMYQAAYYVADQRDGKGKVLLRFMGSNFKQEYSSLDELKKDIKKANIKNAIGYKIYEYEVVKTIELDKDELDLL